MDDTLAKIIETIGDKEINSILEIGAAVGYSALQFSKFLQDNGKIDRKQLEEKYLK